jgi:hypothetical protein
MMGSASTLNLVLATIGIELMALLAYRLIRHRHVVGLDVYANLFAAAGLIGAAQCLLSAAAWGYAALCLLSSLLSHLVALRLRWQGPSAVAR